MTLRTFTGPKQYYPHQLKKTQINRNISNSHQPVSKHFENSTNSL